MTYRIDWKEADDAILRQAAADKCTLGQTMNRLQSRFAESSVKRRIAALGLSKPTATVTAWSEEDVETLRNCIREGLTAAQCAARLQRRHTRNSCIGKALRLSLNFGANLSPKAAKVHNETLERAKRVASRAGGLRVQEKIRAGEIPKPKNAKKGTGVRGTRRTLLETTTIPEPIGPIEDIPDTRLECRAIDGDPRQPGWRCCGHPTVPGRSYCLAHAVRFVDPNNRSAERVRPGMNGALISTGSIQKVFA